MPGSNPIILGRKNCSRCGRWLHIHNFSCQRRIPFKLQSQCHACSREVVREWYRAHPEKRSEYTKRWRDRHLEEERAKGREEQRRRREDPRTKDRVREQARAAWQRMRADPERWAKRLAEQRDQYAKRKADPEWEAARKAKHHAYYHEHGGKEEAAAKRARDKLRREFAQVLIYCLRQELERREWNARIDREERRRWMQTWLADRKARWAAGEFDDLEPVFRNGSDGPELHRLPARPLADWIEAHYESTEVLAREANINPRAVKRYTTGESVTVDLAVIDTIITRTETLLMDIYDPGTYPSLYEVPPEENGNAPASNGTVT